MLPGNISEPARLGPALEKIHGPLPTDRSGPGGLPTVIMDAGLATKDNIRWLRARGYHWVTVRRGAREKPSQDPPAASFRTSKGQQAQAWELEASPGPDEAGGAEAETRLCVWSEGRQAKEDAILRKKRERFEAALRKLHAGLSKPRCLKRYDRVLEKVGRLKETHSLVAKQYEIKVQKGEKQRGKVLAKAVTLRRTAEHERGTQRAGSYVLRTSHTDWDLERVVRTYWRLTDIEATFRSLKGEVGLRPVYHTKAERIRAHLFIAVLAYHGVHFLRQRLAQAGRRDSWATLRGKLSRWTRVTTTLQAADGEWIEWRQDVRPDPEAAAIARELGLPAGLERTMRRKTPQALASASASKGQAGAGSGDTKGTEM